MPNYLLLEDGSYLLLESGDKLELEGETGTETSSSILAYIKGESTGQDTVSGYLSGGIVETSSIFSYIKGQIFTSSSTNVYIEGYTTEEEISSVSAYISGISTSVSSIHNYISGSLYSNSSNSAYVHGQTDSITSIPIYIHGKAETSDSSTAYINGGIVITDSQSGYMYGGGIPATSCPAYMYGEEPVSIRHIKIQSKIGSFQVDHTKAVGYIQSITDLDFQPQVVLFWWSGSATVSGEIVGGRNSNFGIGAGKTYGGYKFCLDQSNIDNYGYSAAETSLYQTQIARFMYLNFNDGILDFYGTTPSGFDVRYYSVFAEDNKVNYLALGGEELTNSYIGYFQSNAASGYYDVGPIPFQPDALITVTEYYSSLNYVGTTARGSIGWATSSGNQAVVTYYDLYGADPTNTAGRGWNENITTYITAAGIITNQASFVEFIPSGFRLYQHIGGNSRHLYLALQGGRYKVGNILTSTIASGEISETVGFEPAVVLFMSANRPLASGISDHDAISFGAADSIRERRVASYWSEDNLASTEISYANYDSAIYANVKHDAIQGLLDIEYMNPTGFNGIMKVPDTTPNWITYLAIGENYPAKGTIIHAFMWGQDHPTSSKHAWLYGHDPNGLEVHSYTHGKLENYSTSTSAYLVGGIQTSSSKNAYSNLKIGGIASCTGLFTVDTTKTVGQTQSITGIDFQPKLLLLWWTGAKTVNESDIWDGEWVNDDFNTGFGAAISDSSRFCVVGFSQNDAAVSNTYRSQNTTEILRTYVASGISVAVDGIFDFYSMDANGFTLVVDDQFSNPYRIGYLALGGNDLTDIKLGTGTIPINSEEFDITDVGFEPQAVIITSLGLSSVNESDNHASLSLGWATSAEEQGVISYLSSDYLSTSFTRRYSRNDELYAVINYLGNIIYRGEFSSFLSNGFRLNNIISAEEESILYYIALKGGQYHVGDMMTSYEHNPYVDIVETGVGFKPNTVLMGSIVDDFCAVNTPVTHTLIAMGFATMDYNQPHTTQLAQCSVDTNAESTQYTYEGYLSWLCFYNVNYWGGMYVKSYDNDGFTAHMDEENGGYDWGSNITYLAIGYAVIEGSIPAYLTGKADTQNSTHAFIEGTTTNARETTPVYLRGYSTDSTSTASYLFGVITTNTSISAYMMSDGHPLSSTHAYMQGKNTGITSVHSYMDGDTRAYVHAFTRGYNPNMDSISAYLKGIAFGPDAWII